MEHTAEVEDLLAAPAPGPGFVAPRYDGHGIASIAPTILRTFGLEDSHPAFDPAVLPPALTAGVRRMVCLVVDALGYRQLLHEIERQPDLFLGRLVRGEAGAHCAVLTSVFPSTTVNALTTMNTGAYPAEHGILGYTLYLQELGAVSEMIRFGPYAGEWSFADAGVDPVAFLGVAPIYGRLREEAGVAAHLVNFVGFKTTALTRMHATGVHYVSYLNASDMAVHIRQLIEAPGDDRVFVSAYYGVLDNICHGYGTASPEHAAEVAALDAVLHREIFARVRRPDTLFVLLADHGHVNCTPERTIDLLEHPALLRDLVVGPTGEGRARYLHVRNGRKEAVRDYVATHFGAISTLLDAEDALARGLFGPAAPTQRARERIGDLVLLPHENWYFHWYPTARQQAMRLVGRHGGLAPEEMLVPLIALRFD